MYHVPKTHSFPWYSSPLFSPLYSYPLYSYPLYSYPYYGAVNTPRYLPCYALRNQQENVPPVQNVFLHAPVVEKENAPRSDAFNEADIKDYGPNPFTVNIAKVARQNKTYRTALWTGKHFQVTVMSINVGDDIGLEVHPATDQFIRIEEGQGLVQMGDSKDKLDFRAEVYDDYAIMIPAGKWHNLTNTGNKPLKIYVIYAPPEHPHGTVHETKAMAMASGESR